MICIAYSTKRGFVTLKLNDQFVISVVIYFIFYPTFFFLYHKYYFVKWEISVACLTIKKSVKVAQLLKYFGSQLEQIEVNKFLIRNLFCFVFLIYAQYGILYYDFKLFCQLPTNK